MKRLIEKLNLRGSIPTKRPVGLFIEDELRGQFSRCQCGNCRCCAKA